MGLWQVLRTTTAAILVYVSVGCARSCEKPKEKVTPTMTVPTFDGAEFARSSSYPFASSLRNSRVFAPRRTFTTLVRYPLEQGQPWQQGENPAIPTALVVSPDGQHGILQYDWGAHVLEGGRDALVSGMNGEPVALDEAYIGSSGVTTWKLANPEEGHIQGTAIVRRLSDDWHAFVRPNAPQPGAIFVPELAIEIRRRHPQHAGDSLILAAHVDGTGVAAIGADWTFVVALKDGTLCVYSPEPLSRNLSPLIAKKQMGFVPADLSLVPPHIVLVESVPTGVRLHVTDGSGEQIWSNDVPVAAGQPPIAGAGRRIYVVGNGIAALDGPELAWAHPSSQSMRATAFADGSLALAVGRSLQVVEDTGVIAQSLETAEPIVTPPAITASGQVWVASQKAVYVAQ